MSSQFLNITATGHVLTDTDTTNFFGFGISPDPITMQPNTAAGQPVSVNFSLDLSQAPVDLGPLAGPDGFGNPNRADYFTNGGNAPGDINWIGWAGLIGTHPLPELTGNGGVADVQMWTAYGSLPVYNQFLVERWQSDITQTPTGPNTSLLTYDIEAATIGVTSDTSPFLHGTSLDQSFSLSGGGFGIARFVETYACTGNVCQVNGLTYQAQADVGLDSFRTEMQSIPEPGVFGLILLAAIFVLVFKLREYAV